MALSYLCLMPSRLQPKMFKLYGDKGDIYSFGIILQEIICREGPFHIKDMELEATGKHCR